MHLFFDFQHRGELFLDDEGGQFVSLGAACDHLVDVLCEFMHSGGEIGDVSDTIIDITDRGKVRLIVAITDIMPEPALRAA